MSTTIAWIGPVSQATLSPVVKAPYTIRTYNRGAGNELSSSAFAAWANTLGSDPISTLCGKADQIILASFSAGHGAVEVALQRALANGTADRIAGLLAVDSYYVSENGKAPKPGFLGFGQHCLETLTPMWFTSSSTGGPGYLSSSDSLYDLAKALSLQPTTTDVATQYGLPTEPDEARVNGPLLWLDYQDAYTHKQHATVLAPAALKSWLVPGGAGSGGATKKGGAGGALVLVGVAGLIGYIASRGDR